VYQKEVVMMSSIPLMIIHCFVWDLQHLQQIHCHSLFMMLIAQWPEHLNVYVITTTTTTTTTVLWPFVWDCPSELEPEETNTHSHLSWSSIILYQLPPSTAIHSILPIQLMCLTVVFHNLCPSLLWSTSWPGILHFILHTFFHSMIVFFLQHMPILTRPVFL